MDWPHTTYILSAMLVLQLPFQSFSDLDSRLQNSRKEKSCRNASEAPSIEGGLNDDDGDDGGKENKKTHKENQGVQAHGKKKSWSCWCRLASIFLLFPRPCILPSLFSPPLYSFSALERTNSFFSPNNVCRSFCPNNGQSVLRRSSSRCSVKL